MLSATAADILDLQRKIGNRAVGRMLQARSSSAPSLQRQARPRPPGHIHSAAPVERTPFGTYRVVPNGMRLRRGAVPEQITEEQFFQLQGTWNQIMTGSGNLVIVSSPTFGREVPGFVDSMRSALGRLLSRPRGRALVMRLVNDGPHHVAIQPHLGPIGGDYFGTQARNVPDPPEGGPPTTGQPRPRPASDAVVLVDPSGMNLPNEVLDRHGRALPNPLYIALGHELIHADHITSGQDERDLAPDDPAYDNREEERTITTGSLTENDLRQEHPEDRLGARYGHGIPMPIPRF